MKHLYFFILFIFSASSIHAQLGTDVFSVGNDNANNYSGSWGTTNLGNGFSDWVFDTATPNGGFAGRFIGSFSAALDVNSDSFGMFANSGNDAASGATTTMPKSLEEGDSFVVSVGVNFRDGNKGFDLRNSSNATIINFNVGSDTYNITGTSNLFGNAYDANTVITLTFTQNAGDVSWTAVRSGGLTGTESGTIGSVNPGTIQNVRFYNVSAGTNGDGGSGQRNLFINSLEFNSLYTITGNSTVASSGDITVPYLDVESGSTLNIPSNSNITVTGALNNSGTINMNSTSSEFPSIIPNGSSTGEINYNRYVSMVGSSGTPGGNDLISLPVMPTTGLNFEELTLQGSPANNTKIIMNGAQTLFAFGPYDNSSNLQFVNYPTFNGNNPPSPTGPPILTKGKGYRAATTIGETLTFTGAIETGNINIGISTPSGGSQWNLIGNPYPSYIDANLFLNPVNSGVMDPSAIAIYGYNSNLYTGNAQTTGNYTIINLATLSLPGETFNIAPGQGFFVASDPANPTGGDIEYIPSMRTISGEDDYIEDRSSGDSNFLKLDLIGSSTYSTSIFFNPNASLGLDPGYDAIVFGENSDNYPIYTHLVEDNLGRAMAIQSLGKSDFVDVIIPLGVNSNQGEQITFSINTSTLPATTEVYLDDNTLNTSTLLTAGDYVLTPTTDLISTGRFYLRFTDSALSASTSTLENLNIYTDNTNKTIVITGQILEQTSVKVYDLQGRIITSKVISNFQTIASIDTNRFNAGVYIVELTNNNNRSKVQKVILR